MGKVNPLPFTPLKIIGNLISSTQVKYFGYLQTVLLSTDFSSGQKPRRAMGYAGIIDEHPATRILKESCKVEYTDQTKWLFGHSEMKHPSPDVFEKSYKDGIIGNLEKIKFGHY